MSLRHAVLGLLAVQPSTGYELTQRFDRSLSNAWHASHSQIYPQLARLQEAGMVEVVSEGARRSRTFAITPAGRDELRRWLVETEPDRGRRDESGVRWFLLGLLDPVDRRAVMEQELAYVIASGAGLDALAAEQATLPGPPPAFHATVDLGQRINAVMEQWLRDQLAALPAEDDGDADDVA